MTQMVQKDTKTKTDYFQLKIENQIRVHPIYEESTQLRQKNMKDRIEFNLLGPYQHEGDNDTNQNPQHPKISPLKILEIVQKEADIKNQNLIECNLTSDETDEEVKSNTVLSNFCNQSKLQNLGNGRK